jgi:hypothetical protein
MNINDLIEQKEAALIWKVVHDVGASDLEISSDPWSRTHTIKIPTSGSECRPIEYLHELAHATLAEKHHLLSTAYFAKGASQSEISPLINPIRVASDWFADALLLLWCPYEEAAEIREHVGYAIRYDGDDPEMLYGGGLVLAQACRYLALRLEEVPAIYSPVVEILLEVNPEIPSVKAKRELINKLAALSCGLRVHLTREDDMELWRVKK